MKKIRTIFFAFAALLITFQLYAQTDPKQERYDRLKQMEQAAERTINFYGIVKDQYGQPVSRAKVHIQMDYFSLVAPYFLGVKDIFIETALDGSFVLNNETGKNLLIADIVKDGFKFNIDSTTNAQRTFEYSNANDPNFFTPDTNNPVVFEFHKKPEPGFVIRKTYDVTKNRLGFDCRVDLPNGIFDLNDPLYRKQKISFVFLGKPTQNQNEYSLILKATDNESGFFDQDGEPHIAPETGYTPLISIILKTGDKASKNIYFKWKKNPTQIVYARMKFNVEVSQENIYLRANLYTNMAGDRNLEYDPVFTKLQLKK